MTQSDQVAELWSHKNSVRPIFPGNRVFSHATCCHWLGRRCYTWSRPAHDHIWPLTLHLDLSKVIRGQWPWLTPCQPIVDSLTVLGVSWGPEIECVANFSHKYVYSASLQKSISVIDPACPQAISAMSVTMILCVTSISSINCNNTLFCLEFNEEYAVESFMSLRFIVFFYLDICM